MENQTISVKQCLAKIRQKKLSPLERVRGRLPALMVGDVVLIRHRHGGLKRMLLRKVTESYWDHSAIIVFTRNPLQGHKNDIIAEAIQPGLIMTVKSGSALHLLDRYLSDPRVYDVGICRVGVLNDLTRKSVRSYALMNIDSPYYPLPFFKTFFAGLSKTYRKYFLYRQRYTCSGFVQKAIYQAVPQEDRNKILFKKGFTHMQIMDVISPGDIAKSECVTWVWNKHL